MSSPPTTLVMPITREEWEELRLDSIKAGNEEPWDIDDPHEILGYVLFSFESGVWARHGWEVRGVVEIRLHGPSDEVVATVTLAVSGPDHTLAASSVQGVPL